MLNLSILLNLDCSHVIMVLVDVANGKPRHIPYRDSRLTFLLQVKFEFIAGFCLSCSLSFHGIIAVIISFTGLIGWQFKNDDHC